MPKVGEARMPLLGCYRCAHLWIPRAQVVAMCPRCKSRFWDVPRIRPRRKARRGAGAKEVIGQHGPAIRRLAREFHAANPRVFGSVARGEATPASDVDIVVRFDSQATLFDHIRLRRTIQELLNRPVDVVDESALHWYSKPQILSEAVDV
jgi:uncharacterized protein